MRYSNVTSNSNFPYPSHNIDPAKKGESWGKDYAKAAYYDFNFVYPKGVFANNGGDYVRNRSYALAQQPTDIYKPMLGVDMTNDNTWMSVKWDIRALIPGYRDKVISKMLSQDYSIECTPVDILAKSEQDKYINEIKAKLAVRQLMLQTNPQMASHPLITMQTGEPLDLEELQMRIQLGEQFNRAKDAELAIELGFYENDYRNWRRSVLEDIFDYGVAAYREWLGDDNHAKFRRCDPENVIVSYSKDATFKDIVHAGELIDVSLIELALLTDKDGNKLFTEQELQEFAGTIVGTSFGNPTSLGIANNYGIRNYDKFKCKVLDIEFYTYNESSYKSVVDENGNIEFKKGDYFRKSGKFTRKRIQYVYKCKWIVGTEKCYDWGMCYDQKRSVDNTKKAKTKLSFGFCAANFYKMLCTPMMTRLIPFADDYQLTMLKIQNFKNRAVPSGWWIDLSALERVAMNKGGKNMTPFELLQMFYDTGVLLGRSETDGQPQSQNYKPVIPIENTAASELAMFYQDLVSTITAVEKMIGYNDITTGNPNPKTLVPGYEIANKSTNDSIAPMLFAEESLSTQLAADVLARMKQGLKKGAVNGFAPYQGALSSNTLRFIELDKDTSLRDHGVELQKTTTEDERNWLLQLINIDIQNGLLDISDAILLINTRNVKECMLLFAMKVKKAKEQQQQNQIQIQDQQAQGNLANQQAASQAAMQQFQMEAQLELRKTEMQNQTELKKEEMKAASQERIAMLQRDAKLQVGDSAAHSKILSTAISSEGDLAKSHLTGLHNQEREHIKGNYAQSLQDSEPETTTAD